MAETKCCKRWFCRLYYVLMALVYIITLLIQLVTLGTFGVQFSNTNNFHDRNAGSSSVCVLYGEGRDDESPFNIRLLNNASCGFTFWALVTVVLVLLVMASLHFVMAIIGRPRIISLFRIPDLIVAVSMAFLSLVISSVLTDGLKRTCNNVTPRDSTSCSSKKIQAFADDGSVQEELSFYPNLNAAMDSSWVVTIIFIVLSIWYATALFLNICKRKYNKKKKKKEEITKTDVGEFDKSEETEKDFTPVDK